MYSYVSASRVPKFVVSHLISMSDTLCLCPCLWLCQWILKSKCTTKRTWKTSNMFFLISRWEMAITTLVASLLRYNLIVHLLIDFTDNMVIYALWFEWHDLDSLHGYICIMVGVAWPWFFKKLKNYLQLQQEKRSTILRTRYVTSVGKKLWSNHGSRKIVKVWEGTMPSIPLIVTR